MSFTTYGLDIAKRVFQRRPTNVAVVAMANKMARTAWMMLVHGRAYQKGYVSQVLA
jgi:transposase